MTKEEDVDRAMLLGLFGCLTLFLLYVTLAVYYLIKIIKTKETIYVCNRCKSKLKSDEIIRNIGNDEEILLEALRERKDSVK